MHTGENFYTEWKVKPSQVGMDGSLEQSFPKRGDFACSPTPQVPFYELNGEGNFSPSKRLAPLICYFSHSLPHPSSLNPIFSILFSILFSMFRS